MNTLRNQFFLGVAVVLLSSAICYSQDIDSDFQQALNMVSVPPGLPCCRVFYDDVQEAADFFVSKHSDTATVEFLQTKIEDPNSRKLALLSLAKLAPANEAAENALYEQIYAKRHSAITAIAYLDPDGGRRIAEILFSHPGPWYVRKAAAEILVGFGAQSSLEMLKHMQPDEKDPTVKIALESAIPQLEYRLTKLPLGKQAGCHG